MIVLPEQGDSQHRLWSDLLDLAAAFPRRWTLIGAHMVALYAGEAGIAARPSQDIDVLANVRMHTDAAREIASFLVDRGYEPQITYNRVAHLFRRETAEEVDLFVPDGLGPRAPTTTIPPNRTIAVPGGTQALQRSEVVAVRIRERTGDVPRPNLLGAIVVKLRAIDVDDLPDAQRNDVALLLALVRDPAALTGQLTPADKRVLRKHAYFSDPGAPEWQQIVADDPELVALVYRRLIG